ncbi:MAG: methyltransferase domain-containing protein [Elusimicrobia bacterium]|nr:methyltransferase domain-containing protein [Elusimicrobiota bacterium]
MDHDIVAKPFHLRKQAWDLPYRDEAFEVIFCSHVIEHISHFKIEQALCEINRVMQKDGILRLLTPDLKKLATAYVNNDRKQMEAFIKDDGSGLKTTLGLGQAFVNFIVSAGYDNFLLSSDFSEILAGYGHVCCYDYEMLSGLLRHYGFHKIRPCDIHDSEIAEHKELRGCPYDKAASYSLIVECRKERFVPFSYDQALLHAGPYRVPDIIPRPRSPLWIAFRKIGYGYNLGKYFLSKLPAPLKDRLKRIFRNKQP